jgi:hypothetical protein
VENIIEKNVEFEKIIMVPVYTHRQEQIDVTKTNVVQHENTTGVNVPMRRFVDPVIEKENIIEKYVENSPRVTNRIVERIVEIPKVKENIIYKEKIVNNTIEKIVEVPRIVEVKVPVETIIEIEKIIEVENPIMHQRIVEKEVLVEIIIEKPVE